MNIREAKVKPNKDNATKIENDQKSRIGEQKWQRKKTNSRTRTMEKTKIKKKTFRSFQNLDLSFVWPAFRVQTRG